MRFLVPWAFCISIHQFHCGNVTFAVVEKVLCKCESKQKGSEEMECGGEPAQNKQPLQAVKHSINTSLHTNLNLSAKHVVC